MIRQITRSALHRNDNDTQVAAYGRTLRAIFDDWLATSKTAGLGVRALGPRLQQAAEAHYQAAYLRGKRQAYPATELGREDRAWIAAALRENSGYVKRSLEADIADKATLQRMQGGDGLEVIRRAFGARVEQQYGGQLWRVTEAGFAAGVRDLAAALRVRFRIPATLRQEDGQDDDEAAILALAILLGLTAARVRRALARAARQPAAGAAPAPPRVADLATATSPATIAASANLGIAPEVLASAAGRATQEVAGELSADIGAEDAALADALDMPEDNLVELGTRARLRGGMRMGVEYIAENDDSTCPDCRSFAGGGEGGIYWEPDEPPLPGSGRCGGNCRCTLSAVYEFAAAAA